MTPCVFGCTCFVQDLSLRLDKLCLRFIKCVFLEYFRTQKGYRCYNPSTRKYLVSTDVTFFESVSYFSPQVPVIISETVSPSLIVSLPTPASTVSSPVPPVETQDPPATKPIKDFRYVYTHRPKIHASKSVSSIPSPVDGPPPPSSASPSDLDIPVTLRKGK